VPEEGVLDAVIPGGSHTEGRRRLDEEGPSGKRLAREGASSSASLSASVSISEVKVSSGLSERDWW